MLLRYLVAVILLAAVFTAHALDAQQARALAAGDNDERIVALQQAVSRADPALERFAQSLLDDEVKFNAERVFIVRDGKAVDAVTGAEVPLPEGVEDVVNNNRMRRELQAALAALKLFSTDAAQRTRAIVELKDQADESKLPLIEKAEGQETDATLKAQLALLKAAS